MTTDFRTFKTTTLAEAAIADGTLTLGTPVHIESFGIVLAAPDLIAIAGEVEGTVYVEPTRDAVALILESLSVTPLQVWLAAQVADYFAYSHFPWIGTLLEMFPQGTPTMPFLADSSGEAYNLIQCDDEIDNGDIFLVENESAIILAWTWPLLLAGDAESKDNQAHTVTDDPDSIKSIMDDAGISYERFKTAHDYAISLGYQLQPWAITWAAHVPAYEAWKASQESK